MIATRESIPRARRIVIKVGTSVATGGDNAFSTNVMGSLVRQIASLSGRPGMPAARSFILVSSGAIALGLRQLHLDARPRAITMLQAAAAMGQSRLMHAYEHEFAAVRRETAQVLLTYEDIRNRERYLNIRNTIFTLWSFGVVPIVNENDTVSFADIRFGDNDILSAHLATMLDADLLILLTDMEGVYDRNPRQHPGATVLHTVTKVTDTVLAGARGKGSDFSTGGMASKIKAADIATRSGAAVIIAQGAGIDLEKVLRGEEIGTFFVPASRRVKGRKKWMAFNSRTEGVVVVDAGARRAVLRQGKSLLPAGVKAVKGAFAMGSVIAIQDEEGHELARGLCNFSSEELEKIRGLNTRKIPEILGSEATFDEVVHRDNLVVTAREE